MLKKAPPPLPKIIGRVDPMYPGLALIEIEKAPKHPVFLKVNVKRIPPQTFYLFNRKTNKVEGLATRIEWVFKPFWIGWSSCGVCHSVFLHCECPNGISASRGIEYTYDKETALLKGEEWDTRHPNYEGSFTKKEREQRSGGLTRPVWVNDTTKDIATVRTPYRPLGGPVKHLLGKHRTEQVLPPRKKLLTKSNSKSSDAVLKDGEVDMDALNREASSSVEEMISHATKRLTKIQTPNKKIIKRK